MSHLGLPEAARRASVISGNVKWQAFFSSLFGAGLVLALLVNR